MKSAAPCLIAFTASFTVPKPVMMIAMMSGIALERGVEDGAAVDAGQPEVRDDDVEREIGEPRERLLAARRLLDDEAMVGQPFGDSFPQRRLVVDEQQMFRVFRHLLARRYFDTHLPAGQRRFRARSLQASQCPSDKHSRTASPRRAPDARH